MQKNNGHSTMHLETAMGQCVRFTWVHLGSLGFTSVHLGLLGLTCVYLVHLGSLGFTWVHLVDVGDLGYRVLNLENESTYTHTYKQTEDS